MKPSFSCRLTLALTLVFVLFIRHGLKAYRNFLQPCIAFDRLLSAGTNEFTVTVPDAYHSVFLHTDGGNDLSLDSIRLQGTARDKRGPVVLTVNYRGPQFRPQAGMFANLGRLPGKGTYTIDLTYSRDTLPTVPLYLAVRKAK